MLYKKVLMHAAVVIQDSILLCKENNIKISIQEEQSQEFYGKRINDITIYNIKESKIVQFLSLSYYKKFYSNNTAIDRIIVFYKGVKINLYNVGFILQSENNNYSLILYPRYFYYSYLK